MADEKKHWVQEFIDALHGRDWRSIRRLLLVGLVVGAGILIEKPSIVNGYQPYVWAAIVVVFAAILVIEVFFSRPHSRKSEGLQPGYTRSIRGLLPFGEDDEAVFANLGRAPDIAKLENALLSSRLTVLQGESGSGKTSLLRAGFQPKLKKLGLTSYIYEVNNLEELFASVTRLLITDSETTGDAITLLGNSLRMPG